MKQFPKTLNVAAIFLALAAMGPIGTTSGEVVPSDVQSLLNNYCVGCHGDQKQKGKIRLDQFDTLSGKSRLNLLSKAEEALHAGDMPPEDAKQPTALERKTLLGWVNGQLELAGGSDLKDKLRYPHYGNLVDHEKLFSGGIKDKPYSPSRRWLVSPQIFHERVMNVFKLEGRDRDAFKTRSFYGVTNPFVLPDPSGVRDYDITMLDGGHLLVMLTNAQWIASKQMQAARIKHGEPGAGDTSNPKDRWYPRTTPLAFETVILKTTPPTDEELIAAIQTQFDCVLGRKPSQEELSRYLKLTRASVELGGNTDGLHQMLMSVLLESEFLYRVEFGAGKVDSFGRKMLSPSEASYAISYALGDRGPDPQLIKAAAEGRLLTKEDYKREVTRLLSDPTYYFGQVDPVINGQHYQSNQTSHPKIVRFFREFFGYTGAMKVFKDEPRSGGTYSNPGRGTAGTPGRLILETDRIVTMFVERDEHVFENLLTSDEFFVYHDRDNETGRKIIEEWKGVYEKLKGTDWKKNPEQVVKENLAFLKAQKSMGITNETRAGELVNYMHYFDETFGQGRTPFTTPSWTHGYYLHHSPLYNLPPTPPVGRFGSWKSTQYLGDKVEKVLFWDYPTRQPFKIENRKGILTHPSWLIAHSSNLHPDPIRRGRWIQEKLLAGRVPDVPITVDATVPEDPHKTFRQRVEMVTKANECWKCHKYMNPLGLPFEIYDDFGRYRKLESMEHPDNLLKAGNGKSTFDVYKTAPIVSTGELTGTGDSTLDGSVKDALDLIDRLGRSERVRQSIIRHAFRFYMGRNEVLSDSQSLIDADHAYIKSGGSFKAVIVSLLTSDSFMYRKEEKGKK